MAHGGKRQLMDKGELPDLGRDKGGTMSSRDGIDDPQHVQVGLLSSESDTSLRSTRDRCAARRVGRCDRIVARRLFTVQPDVYRWCEYKSSIQVGTDRAAARTIGSYVEG